MFFKILDQDLKKKKIEMTHLDYMDIFKIMKYIKI